MGASEYQYWISYRCFCVDNMTQDWLLPIWKWNVILSSYLLAAVSCLWWQMKMLTRVGRITCVTVSTFITTATLWLTANQSNKGDAKLTFAAVVPELNIQFSSKLPFSSSGLWNFSSMNTKLPVVPQKPTDCRDLLSGAGWIFTSLHIDLFSDDFRSKVGLVTEFLNLLCVWHHVQSLCFWH